MLEFIRGLKLFSKKQGWSPGVAETMPLGPCFRSHYVDSFNRSLAIFEIFVKNPCLQLVAMNNKRMAKHKFAAEVSTAIHLSVTIHRVSTTFFLENIMADNEGARQWNRKGVDVVN
jgi:hypothetical protein